MISRKITSNKKHLNLIVQNLFIRHFELRKISSKEWNRSAYLLYMYRNTHIFIFIEISRVFIPLEHDGVAA